MGALVLSRRIGERIVIGDDITVTVSGIAGAQARLAVDAPKSITVHREEVAARIARAARQQEADHAAQDS